MPNGNMMRNIRFSHGLSPDDVELLRTLRNKTKGKIEEEEELSW